MILSSQGGETCQQGKKDGSEKRIDLNALEVLCAFIPQGGNFSHSEIVREIVNWSKDRHDNKFDFQYI